MVVSIQLVGLSPQAIASPIPVINNWTHFDGSEESSGIDLGGRAITYSSVAIADLDNNTENGLEIVGAGEDGSIYAIHADGSLAWRAETPNATCGGGGNKTLSTPAIGVLKSGEGPSVVIGYGALGSRGCDGGVVALRGSDGSVRWKFSLKQFSSRERYGTLSYTVFSTPAIGDVDNDGNAEIGFGGFDRNVYLLNADGSVRWYYNAADTVWSSAAFADIDNDGKREMIIGTDISQNRHLRPATKNGGFVYAFRTKSQTPRRISFRNRSAYLWNRYVDQVVYSSPVVADVVPSSPGDEIIIQSGCYFPENISKKKGAWIKVLRPRDGRVIRTLPVQACSPSSVAVGDIDEDGVLDIVATVSGNTAVGGTGRSTVVAYNAERSQLLWSVIPRGNGKHDSYGGHFTSPVIADIDQNGSLEVVVANSISLNVFAGATGSPLTCQARDCSEDTPALVTGGALRGTPAIGDINGDGVPDVIVGGVIAGNRSAGIYGWTDFAGRLGSESGTHSAGAAPWPTARGSAARIGISE